MDTYDIYNKIYGSFNKSVRALIALMGNMQITDQSVIDSVTLLRRKYTIIKACSDQYMLDAAMDIFLVYADRIRNRDVEYFLQADIINECKALDIELSETDEIFTLINNIRILYNISDSAVRDEVISHITNMLTAVEIIHEVR